MSDANRVQLACIKEDTFGVIKKQIVGVPTDPAPANTGEGAISQPTAIPAAPTETWTVDCKDIGTPAVFSVEGSVSGAKADATAEVAYDNGLVAFTITANGAAFIVGDDFAFTVEKADLQVMRITGESLKQDTTVVVSEEIRSDRQIADIIRTGVGASGGIDFELSYATFDDFLQAILFSDGWSTEVTLPSAPSALSDPAPANTGEGVLTDIIADHDAPVETWTVTCTDVGTPAIFSVVGSVSGTKANATAEVAYDNGLVAFLITATGTAFAEDDDFAFGITRGKIISALVDDNSFNEILTPVPIIAVGNGLPEDITSIAAPGATPPTVVPSETWTMICTVKDLTFSVVGSVSGTVTGKETATCGTPYDNGFIKFTIGDTVDDWEVGDEFVITNNFSGLTAKQWIRVSGFPTISAANNGWFKMTSVTSLKVVVTHGTLVTASVGETIVMQMGAQILNGVTLASWNIERKYVDLDPVVYALFTGMCLGEMSLDIPADGRITGSFTLLGSKEKTEDASQGTGHTKATTTNIVTGANHVDDIFENKQEAKILSLSMSINNNLRTRLQVGTLGAVSVGSGSILITGSLELYLPDATLFDKYLDQTPSSLSFGVTDGAGNGYIIEIPTMRITDGTRPAGGLNTDVVGTFEWQAYMNPTEEISIRITRFPVIV